MSIRFPADCSALLMTSTVNVFVNAICYYCELKLIKTEALVVIGDVLAVTLW